MAPVTSSVTLPVIPLTKGSVLLPGTVLRVPVPASRTDVRALLSRVYALDATARLDNAVVCVPLASPLLSKTGQRLLPRGKDDARPTDNDISPAAARKQDLFGMGTTAKIAAVDGQNTGQLALIVEGVARVKVDRITQERPYFEAAVIHHEDVPSTHDAEVRELFKQLKSLSSELLALLQMSSMFSRDSRLISPLIYTRLGAFIGKKQVEDAGSLADFMVNIVEASVEEKLQVLAAFTVKDRLEKAVELLTRQVGKIKSGLKNTTITVTTLPSDVDIDSLNNQNERKRSAPGGMPPPGFMNMMGTGGGSPNGKDNQEPNEMDELKKKLDEAQLSPEASKVAERELQRLQKMSPAQAEYQVCRNYLETLAEIPWSKVTEDQLGVETLTRARKQLDSDHYGLERVKKRLLEYLAVLKLKQSVNKEVDARVAEAQEEVATLESDKATDDDTEASEALEEKVKATSAKLEVLKHQKVVDKSPILLLVGPPGVGKTSLAKSVATALGRKFHRISLGGVRDEAEIRGHRRTYVAAMPGLIVNSLKKVGVANPVILLDEIDKVGGSSFHGDPSAAMLEVLDPEQNHSFVDHFVNIPIDLSKVLFIATANSLDTIPPPLLDRMETISLAGYTSLEKRHIATQHLIPKQIRSNGLSEDQVLFPGDVVSKIIDSYTRESGVRNLEREIGSVCRYKAVEFADAQDAGHPETYNPLLSLDDVEAILGIEKFEEEIAEKSSRPGIVTGLVAYSSGGNGSILFIEVADMPGKGSVQLTGSLGDVLRESVEVALTWVKAHAFELGLTSDPTVDIMSNRSIHVHCPSGAIPKDGPSAGMAHTMALVSLFSGKPVPPALAMTGEISLRGRVTAVGGIKEKLIGAMRAGVKTVLLPAQNRKDAKELPAEVKNGLEIIFVSHIWEAMRHVWPDAHWPGEQHYAGVESRL